MFTTIVYTGNTGDDIPGSVEEVGSAVASIKPGDRVAALHQLNAPYESYAEYALVKDFICLTMASIGSQKLRLPWQRTWHRSLCLAHYGWVAGLSTS